MSSNILIFRVNQLVLNFISMPPTAFIYELVTSPSDTKEVTLRFTGVRIIWKFTRDINTFSYLMNAGDKTLTCRCSAAEIELACKQYGAEITEV